MDVPMNSAVESASVLGSLLASSEAVPQSTPPTMATTNTGLDTPPPTTTTTPLIIGLISSGPDTKATLTVPGVKSLPPPKPNPPQLEPHGSGKPKAFLSMMSEGSRTSPSKKHTPTTKKGVKDSTPRTSQRAIKRRRYYDDEDDIQHPKSGGKKTKVSNPKSNKSVNKKPPHPSKSMSAAKDLGRWRPTDDLMLISAVQQTNDLTAVYLGIKFSCRFTLREIEERWYALLYSPQISHIAIEAMRGLHPGVVTMALNNALWSQEEEAVLAKIPSSDAGHLETFQNVLKDHPAVFHACRTATSLHHHWVLMGHYNLLNDQKVQLIPPGDNVTDFTDAEEQRTDSELMKSRDVREEALEQELMISDRQSKREILSLEDDLPTWRTVLDTPTTSELHAGEVALFRGKVVEFRMTKPSVTFGRATPTNKVDFDLSLEGPAYKISRRQASIHQTEEGEFLLHNEGRRALFVDGRAVLSGRSARLESNQTIEVVSMAFLVILNSKAQSSS